MKGLVKTIIGKTLWAKINGREYSLKIRGASFSGGFWYLSTDAAVRSCREVNFMPAELTELIKDGAITLFGCRDYKLVS